MSLFGSMFQGASSASLWTGNMIYTALQNARTKKETSRSQAFETILRSRQGRYGQSCR